MLCTRPRPKPMIGKLPELLISGPRATALDAVPSPRSPLDLKNVQSPRDFKSSYEMGGVGLGIVVSLCNSNLNHSDGFPTSDFLSSCHLCGKNLHGKDIYIYRGESAFCSSECRARQMMMDEGNEKSRSEASRSVEMASSPANRREQIFSSGVLVI